MSVNGTQRKRDRASGSEGAPPATHIPPIATNGGDSVESAVRARYSAAAQAPEAALCCPSNNYDPELLAMLPAEIVERDYGCGNPSKYVAEGETVVDLGCGAGKICYMLSGKVGPPERGGQVFGIDFNDSMLALARKHQSEMARKIGYANVRFIKARIQDMALNLDELAIWLATHPVMTLDGADALEIQRRRLRTESPAVANDSVDVVVSNCVLNLVRPEDKAALFDEIFRVLKKGGRAIISDIVCDETPPPAMRSDPQLWSGCIAGAFREDEFLERFEKAAGGGFFGIEILERADKPWQVIDGIEFRSMTVRAFKGKHGPCFEHNQAVIYKGPWKKVIDDDGHTFMRGQRMAVCDKTFKIMTKPSGAYAAHIVGIEPLGGAAVAPENAKPLACNRQGLRDPRQTKGLDYRETIAADGESCCTDGSCC